ncbi:MGMT family protein [Pontibacterium sp. N1Y112]|uniref:MGMT family protein n=1 Tax=Pontibacterium sinense TaxID=2781979 RepID=A0A8J7FG52_9GAMM|nr:MGMT family protein [Pontibacterium sinense]MBE9396728.1 MGMT family protein [Pontibacterium sinense]
MNEPSYQEKFWQIISLIPSGSVATYGQVAELAGLPSMARAVGRTLSQLPKDTQLPWFRVINAKGEISFPKDSPPYQRQRSLLEADGVVFIRGKVSLRQYKWQP